MGVLFERESELAALGQLVDAAAAGHGGAVLVEGEAGIGKTRLLAPARACAEAAGVRVLFATAEETEAGVPLAAARVLLSRAARGVALDGPARLGLLALAGGLPDPSGLGSRRDEVVHALWWLIVELADDQPLALMVDDAQWADDLTLRLLRTMARRAPELPLALVVAQRPATSGQRHAGVAAERAFVRLEPAPLSVAGTARMLEEVLGRPGTVAVVARTRAVTRGNPLYLAELLRDARERGIDPASDGRPPPQLVRLVADRLARLSPAATALARAAAVLGADADATRAHALAGLGASEAIAADEELRGERVLEPGEYAFAHPLVAAAAREGIGAAEAAELHARAARLLAADGVADERVAEHLMHAPSRGDASTVSTLRRAAEAARRLGALSTAVRLLERALAEPPPPQEVDAIDLERGRSQLDAGEEDGAKVLTRLARHALDASVRADAARGLAQRFGLRGRGPEAVAVCAPSSRRCPRATARRGSSCSWRSRSSPARTSKAHAEAARMIAAEAARATGRTAGERLVMVAAARVTQAENPSDPVSEALELLAQRLHRDYPVGFAVGSLTFGATALLMNGDALVEAERAMDILRADAEAMALPDLIAGALWQQAQIAYLRGDLPRCELEGRGSIEVGADFARRLATPWLVMALAEQDRLDEAERLLESADMLGPIPPNDSADRGARQPGAPAARPGRRRSRGRGSRRRRRAQRGVEPAARRTAVATAAGRGARAGRPERRGRRGGRRLCEARRRLGHPAGARPRRADARANRVPRSGDRAARGGPRPLCGQPRPARAGALPDRARRPPPRSRRATSRARDPPRRPRRRPCMRRDGALRAGTGRAATRRRPPAAADRRRRRRPHARGAPGGRNRRRRRYQPGDCAPPLPLAEDRRDAPAQRLPQARPHGPRRTRHRASEHGRDVALDRARRALVAVLRSGD